MITSDLFGDPVAWTRWFVKSTSLRHCSPAPLAAKSFATSGGFQHHWNQLVCGTAPQWGTTWWLQLQEHGRHFLHALEQFLDWPKSVCLQTLALSYNFSQLKSTIPQQVSNFSTLPGKALPKQGFPRQHSFPGGYRGLRRDWHVEWLGYQLCRSFRCCCHRSARGRSSSFSLGFPSMYRWKISLKLQ